MIGPLARRLLAKRIAEPVPAETFACSGVVADCRGTVERVLVRAGMRASDPVVGPRYLCASCREYLTREGFRVEPAGVVAPWRANLRGRDETGAVRAA